MTSNSTQPNTTESGCVVNEDTVFEYWLYSSIVCSVASFVGNVLIILTVYKTKKLRTTTNYFVVNMAVSDVFEPACDMLYFVLYNRKDAPALTKTFGTILCKLLAFLVNTSYGVSMSSLVVITVHRFYAVAFPMRARLESGKTRAVLLLCTWLLPMTVYCPLLYYFTYISETKICSLNMREMRLLNWNISFLVFFVALPFLFMLVLYPVIVVKLVRQKVPGNSSSKSQVIRRRKQNIRLTKLFTTTIVALLLTYDIFQISYVIYVHSLVSNLCASLKFYNIVYPFPNIFHAINPVIYFIFCSSYRQGIKQIFSCCCRHSTVRSNLPGAEQMELGNVPQE